MPSKLSDVPAVERLFNLSAFLLRTKTPVTLKTIIREVEGYSSSADYEAGRKMFARDKSELAAMGINIRMEKIPDPASGQDTDGYIIDEDDFYLPKIRFSSAEIEALAGAVEQFRNADAFRDNALNWALMKLVGPDGAASGAGAGLLQLDGGGRLPDESVMESARRSILYRKKMKIKYRSGGSGESTLREIHPYGLFLRRGFWYIVAYCMLRKNVRTFRLDRLEIASQPRGDAEPDFEIPADFSLASYIRNRAPWEYGAADSADVVIKFAEDVFWQVKNAWGNLASVEFDSENCLMKTVSVNNEALALWTLEFGDKAEVVSPPAMRDAMAKMLGGMLADAGTDS